VPASQGIGWNFASVEYWQHTARTMGRGLFDAMFIADELAPYNTHEDSSDAIVRWAVQCPTHEPSTIVPIIAAATKHLGVGVTLSTAFEHPYSMCRRLSSLDHLSNGRVAWNIVSSYSKSEWDAYRHTMTERSGRYDRLEEYMEVCYKLWDSWESEAIVADKASGIYAEPTKVRVVHHTKASIIVVTAGIFCAPSPQGRPVLWQAGSSNQGATSPRSMRKRSLRFIRTSIA
jgi:long-chain alkane monooxygenase